MKELYTAIVNMSDMQLCITSFLLMLCMYTRLYFCRHHLAPEYKIHWITAPVAILLSGCLALGTKSVFVTFMAIYILIGELRLCIVDYLRYRKDKKSKPNIKDLY